MKKIFSFIIISLIISLSVSAKDEKGSSIALSIIPSDYPQDFPEIAKAQITNKLRQMITENGLAASDDYSNFFIAVEAVPQTKEVIQTTPAQVAQILDLTFYIADYARQIVFASTSVTVKGIGINDAKSYMDALKKVNVRSTQIVNFVANGKAKIVDYYDAQADNIFMKVNQLAKMHNYEEALYLLSSFPTESKKYNKSVTLGNDIYQQYVDRLCTIYLAKAKTAWVSQQNRLGAEEAGTYLSEIYPDASCYADANALFKEIKSKILDDWNFEMKQYQDGVDLESQKIKAWRDVGVAYGNGQQPTSTNIGWLK